MEEVGSDVVGIRLSPFTEFYGANESGKLLAADVLQMHLVLADNARSPLTGITQWLAAKRCMCI